MPEANGLPYLLRAQAPPMIAADPRITPDMKANATQGTAMPLIPQNPFGGGMSSMVADPTMGMAAPAMPNVVHSQAIDNREKLDHLNATGAGVDQIKNPWARGFAKAGDIALSIVAPRIASFVPGTTLHHQGLVGQQEGIVDKDNSQADMQAQIAQRNALTEQEQAKAEMLRDPQKAVDPSRTVTTDDGVFQLNPQTGRYDQRVGDRVEKQKSPEQTAFDSAIDSGQTPLQAFGTVNQAKNTKDSSFQQQYLDWYMRAHPEIPLTDAISTTIRATSTQPKIEIHQASAPAAPAFGASDGRVNPTIQAYIDGRIPAPNARTKQGAAIMRAITDADPTYDASRYNTYQAMQKEMTSGKTGASINSLNTIQEHIARALVNMPDNGSSSTVNWLKNSAEEAVGKNPTGKYEVDATGIAGEWGKLVAGGVASEGEQKHVQALLSPNASPTKMRDNLAEVKAMTDGKLAAIKKQVESGAHPGPGSNQPTSLPEGGGQSGRAVSLKEAMALPQNSGKSESSVRKDIESHGHAVKP